MRYGLEVAESFFVFHYYIGISLAVAYISELRGNCDEVHQPFEFACCRDAMLARRLSPLVAGVLDIR